MPALKGWRPLALVALVIPLLIGSIFIVRHFQHGSSGPRLSIPAEINSISMLASDDGWAVGTAANGALITHFHNGQWSRVAAPTLPTNTPYSLDYLKMTSLTDGWAIGHAFPGPEYVKTQIPDPALTKFGQIWLHFDGTAWSFWQNRFVTGQLMSFAPDSWWAVGSPITAANQTTNDRLLLHYDGHQIQSLPLPVGPNDGRLIRLTGEQNGWFFSAPTVTGVHVAEDLYQESQGAFTRAVTVPNISPGTAYGYGFALSVANGNGWFISSMTPVNSPNPTYRTVIQVKDGHWATPIQINTDSPTQQSLSGANAVLPRAGDQEVEGYYAVTTNQGDAPEWVAVLDRSMTRLHLYHQVQGQWKDVGQTSSGVLIDAASLTYSGGFSGPTADDLWLPVPSNATNGSLVRYHNGQWQTWSVQADGSLSAA